MPFIVTSRRTEEYTCISWALSNTRQVIWPDEDEQLGWPAAEIAPREETLEAFQRLFMACGFEVCQDGQFQAGIEKLAIHAKNGLVTHASRQLPTGEWTSKVGSGADGTHEYDHFVPLYGRIELYMMRVNNGEPPILPQLYPQAPRLINPDGGILIR